MVRARRHRGAANPVPDTRIVRRALVRWFSQHRRPLPWRRDRDPYRIWVAEVLLQQTRVAHAAPYFERFLQRFPDVTALARARLPSVLRVWAGAGYYGRARHLHEAAREIVREHRGRIPRTPEELGTLPGIGPYIANAVATFAFDAPVLAMEANGLRCAARLTGEEGAISDRTTQDRLAGWLREGLTRHGSREFNEALMELGETTCTPQGPRCHVCPVASCCVAVRRYKDPSVLPRRRPPRSRPHVIAAIAAVYRGKRLLLQRRPARGLLGGFWELPGGKLEPGETPDSACRREVQEEVGVRLRRLDKVGVIQHAYSHFSVELHLFAVRLPSRGAAPPPSEARRWVTPAEIRRLPIPRATEKALDLLDRSRWGRPSQG